MNSETSIAVNFVPEIAQQIAPTAAILAPTSGQIVSGLFTISGTAADNRGLMKAVVSSEKGAILADIAMSGLESNWSAELNTLDLSTGTQSINVAVTDIDSNTVTASVVVIVPNEAPAIAVTSHIDSAAVSGLVTISGTASDNVGVARVEISINGAGYERVVGTASWSYVYFTTMSLNGEIKVYAKATNVNGNTTVAERLLVVSHAYPSAVEDLDASPKEGRAVLLTWNPPSTGIVSEYRVYFESEINFSAPRLYKLTQTRKSHGIDCAGTCGQSDLQVRSGAVHPSDEEQNTNIVSASHDAEPFVRFD